MDMELFKRIDNMVDNKDLFIIELATAHGYNLQEIDCNPSFYELVRQEIIKNKKKE